MYTHAHTHTHTHIFPKWGHWTIRGMKKKKKSQDSHFNYLYSSVCLAAVSARLWPQLTSLLLDVVMRNQFAMRVPSMQRPRLDLIAALKDRCVFIPPLPLYVTAAWTRQHHLYYETFILCSLWKIFDRFHRTLVMVRPAKASSRANCMALLVSLRRAMC